MDLHGKLFDIQECFVTCTACRVRKRGSANGSLLGTLHKYKENRNTMEAFLMSILKEVFLGQINGINGLIVAAGYIIAVYILAQILGWGQVKMTDGRFLVPGGAMAFNFPIIELVFVLGLPPLTSPGAQVLELIALHFLRVRILLFVYAWGGLLLSGWLGEQVSVRACIDGRFEKELKKIHNANCLHWHVCGAFVSLTLLGAVPVIVFLSIFAFLGADIPVVLVYIGMFPWLLVFGKIVHVGWVGEIADLLMLSEVPMGIVMSLLSGTRLRIISLSEGDEE